MSDRSWNEFDKHQRLSMLLDGEADDRVASEACSGWRDDEELRANWHAWHLIGDVLRSEDLAHPVARDRQFLASVRERLAQEPVVLAPQRQAAPAAVAPPPRRRRVGALAVAAGFAAVASVAVVSRMAGAPEPGVQTFVAVPPSETGLRTVSAAGSGVREADAQPATASGTLIRDARLDRYLATHKQYGDGSALVPPGGIVRSSVVVPAR